MRIARVWGCASSWGLSALPHPNGKPRGIPPILPTRPKKVSARTRTVDPLLDTLWRAKKFPSQIWLGQIFGFPGSVFWGALLGLKKSQNFDQARCGGGVEKNGKLLFYANSKLKFAQNSDPPPFALPSLPRLEPDIGISWLFFREVSLGLKRPKILCKPGQ